jgi:hypothetical protein
VQAADQTGRLDVPMIDAPVKLADLLDGWEAGRRLMFCDETGGAPVTGAVTVGGCVQDLAVCEAVTPEDRCDDARAAARARPG